MTMGAPEDRILSEAAAALIVNDLPQSLNAESQEKQSGYGELSRPQDGNISDSSGDASVSSGEFMTMGNGHEVNPESGVFYSTNGYATTAAYGFDYSTDWERYVGLNGLDPSVYPENGSVVYQPSYGYSQPYGQYTPYQPVYADGQLYGHSAFHFPAPIYDYSVVEADGSKSDGSTAKGLQRPGYPITMVSPYGHFPRGVMSFQSTPQDGRSSFEGLRASAPAWVSSECRRPSHPNKAQSPQPSQQKPRAPPAFPGALGTAFPPLTRAVLSSSKETNENKQKGRGPVLNNGNDVTSEQNRGPRTTKGRSQRIFPVLKQSGEDIESIVARDKYNSPEFSTSYNDAKFYIIKSYSEDDVHKSIKYGVWASTPNGNKRLDAAYREAQAKAGGCPVFLLFSVNASGQFCGLAEMTGPVDFVKSMDFWQQDKWSGCFSVKWHIIKDIPNGHCRHIILENNENKPITNSRDTQEVHFKQGIEMLKIFKNYTSSTSILDDFEYYESRQKAMQEKRSRQVQKQQYVDVNKGTENLTTNATSTSKDDSNTSGVVSGVARKSYLRSLAGDKDVPTNIVDVKAA